MLNLSPVDLKIILAFMFAGGITFFMIPSIVEMSNLKHLVALPNRRTSHQTAVPNLGGIAIYIGLVISYLLFLKPLSFPKFQFIVAGSMIIFFVGFKDDITGLNAFKKFFGQFLATWIVISFGGLRLTSLYGFFGIWELETSVSYGVTIIAIIGITNCFNLMDGIDGLSAGLAIIAAAFFGTWFYLIQDYDYAILAFGMMGSLLAFGYFNVFGVENKIFMGDTGSLIIGFIMAVMAIHFNMKNLDPAVIYQMKGAPAVSIGFIMIPLFDTLRVMVTRMLNRTSPFHPDRTHIHHYLLKLGFSHRKSTMILLLTAICFAALSYALCNMGVFRLLVVQFILAGIFTYYVINKVEKKVEK